MEWQKPVKELIWERLALTMVLSAFTMLFSWFVSIPVGVYSATHQYSALDYTMSLISFVGVGVPSFLIALVVMWIAMSVFGLNVGGLFSEQYVLAPWSWDKVVDMLKHLWIPALVSAVTGTGGLIRIMRGNLLETLGQPFIEAARARGLKNSTVIWKHAVRMAINPLIVILGSEAIPNIFVGNALVSIVLNLPTIGPLFVESLRKLDMYMAGTCLVFFTLLLLIGNLLADLMLAWVDPRIRLD